MNVTSIFPFLIVKSCCYYLQQSIRVAEKITQKVEGQLSKSQKEFLLRQQVSFHTAIIIVFFHPVVRQ